jgi:hypothetical protein
MGSINPEIPAGIPGRIVAARMKNAVVFRISFSVAINISILSFTHIRYEYFHILQI